MQVIDSSAARELQTLPALPVYSMVRTWVRRREPFRCGAPVVFGVRRGSLYCVFSQSHAFPLFVHDGKRWLENASRKPQGLNLTWLRRHRSVAHPIEQTRPCTHEQILSTLHANEE
jgi:hypothetical protein